MAQAQCPACARLQQPRLLCAQCGAPLGVELDYFTALELPRDPLVDEAALQRAYHDFSRRLHPDRFANQPAAMRAASLRATALLTRAVRTLRDPVSRGLYWLQLHGEKLAVDNKQVPPELVELIFAIQEELGELRAASGEASAHWSRVVQERREEINGALAQELAALERNFARWGKDEGLSKPAAPLMTELKTVLSRIAYLRSVLRDVERALGEEV
ncbi:MAG TPA: hypothetical protein VKV28_14555 [Candidatus Binataceae bacterium]|nr:hypothetical protein [Candidatus Binataceae bacterium]